MCTVVTPFIPVVDIAVFGGDERLGDRKLPSFVIGARRIVEWTCPVCTLLLPLETEKCTACEAARPALPEYWRDPGPTPLSLPRQASVEGVADAVVPTPGDVSATAVS